MSFKEKLKDKKEKIVNWTIDHQVEVIQATGAVIATGIFVVRTLINKNKKDEDDDKTVYNIENYYEIDKYYENEKTEE